jgi:hypothetical protein
MMVPLASLTSLPIPWFERSCAFDSHLYHHVVLRIFLDSWSGTDIKKSLQVLMTGNEYGTVPLTSLIGG